MTSLVGILCKNGVVIASDSAATLGSDPQHTTVETPTKKIETIGDGMILAGTGAVGLNQRFAAIIRERWDANQFQDKGHLEIAKILSAATIQDFASTQVAKGQYGALVAYTAKGRPQLCEFGLLDLQPEMKEIEKLWFTSMGSAQPITDAFLVFLLFWPEGAPNLEQGLFLAIAALDHAIEVNTGGVNGPIQVSVLEAKKPGQYRARDLDSDEIGEHINVVLDAQKHFAEYSQRWSSAGKKEEIPEP